MMQVVAFDRGKCHKKKGPWKGSAYVHFKRLKKKNIHDFEAILIDTIIFGLQFGINYIH